MATAFLRREDGGREAADGSPSICFSSFIAGYERCSLASSPRRAVRIGLLLQEHNLSEQPWLDLLLSR